MENRNGLRLRVRPMAVNKGEWIGGRRNLKQKTRLGGGSLAQISTMPKSIA